MLLKNKSTLSFFIAESLKLKHSKCRSTENMSESDYGSHEYEIAMIEKNLKSDITINEDI